MLVHQLSCIYDLCVQEYFMKFRECQRALAVRKIKQAPQLKEVNVQPPRRKAVSSATATKADVEMAAGKGEPAKPKLSSFQE